MIHNQNDIKPMIRVFLQAQTLSSIVDLDDMVANLASLLLPGIEPKDLLQIVAELRDEFSSRVGDGAMLLGQNQSHVPWLPGRKPQIDAYFWNRYREYLSNHSSLGPSIISGLDASADRVLGSLDDPLRDGPWDRRGLVLGHVQSGKTSNYLGLMTKAADAGYKVFIVIAGDKNTLRQQTQMRVEEGFIGWDQLSNKWVGVGSIRRDRRVNSFTTWSDDFKKSIAKQLGLSLSNIKEPAVFVIKKNLSTLRNLTEWLQSSAEGGRIHAPLLLIDDEADYASINTKAQRDEISAINGSIRSLLNLFERSSMVAYTATPFANILIDHNNDDAEKGEDLFPRDFILSLDPPTNYLSPERVFGTYPKSELVITIDDNDELLPQSHKSTYTPLDLPESLVDSIRAFIVARAIRIERGQASKHSSMMINVSGFVKVQKALQPLVSGTLSQFADQIRLYGALPLDQAENYPALADLHSTFDRIYPDIPESWAAIRRNLWQAVAPIEVRVINGTSPDNLPYQEHDTTGLHVIAIGGMTLSRGLTLEGLSTSYLVRNSRQYDTLLQMGRWFGYHPNFEDLCRIWMPEELAGWFQHISEASEELRQDLRMMQSLGAKPIDFGLRVRMHPARLLITANNKRGSGVAVPDEISFDGKLVQTARLNIGASALGANRTAATNLAARLLDLFGAPMTRDASSYFSTVPWALVESFLNDWVDTPIRSLSSPDNIKDYVYRSELNHRMWDVSFSSIYSGHESGLYPFPIKVQSRKVAGRHARNETIEFSNQNFASSSHELIGLSDQEIERAINLAEEGKVSKDPSNVRTFYRRVRTNPLLLIYTINLTGTADQSLSDKPVIAWAISFPVSHLIEPTRIYLANSVYQTELMGSEDDEEEED